MTTRTHVCFLAWTVAVAGCSKSRSADVAPSRVVSTADISLDALWSTPLKTLDGNDTSASAFDGKALLIVNVASKCGLTPQYKTLEAIHKKYADRGFTVVGFPCNQFAGQEPGTHEEIAQFCSMTYGVTFPMMEKVEVNGARRHPMYSELSRVADASGYQGDIRWNFEKFVVSSDRKSITRFAPDVLPDSAEVTSAIESGLPK